MSAVNTFSPARFSPSHSSPRRALVRRLTALVTRTPRRAGPFLIAVTALALAGGVARYAQVHSRVWASGPIAAAPSDLGAVPLPKFSDRPFPQTIAPGVEVSEITFAPAAGVSTTNAATPPGQTMRLWLYLPAGAKADHSLPCVIIAPSGTNLMVGKRLGEKDRQEHIPYVKAGFAVVAYDLDGDVAGGLEGSSRRQQADAMRRFIAADGGRVNARNAIEYILAKVPEVDGGRLYAAGHSSAATVALWIAENDSRIRGCLAFAPVCDIEMDFGPQGLAKAETLVKGEQQFLTHVSPIHSLKRLAGPVYLFHADDDDNVPAEGIIAFAAGLRAANHPFTPVNVPTGGHYQSMLSAGISGAIPWLRHVANPQNDCGE